MDNIIASIGLIVTIVIGIKGIWIYKTKLYKDTYRNLIIKRRACNFFIRFLSVLLIFTIGITVIQILIFLNNNLIDRKDISNKIVWQENDSDEIEVDNWKNAYQIFLKEYIILKKKVDDVFQESEYQFALYDIDKDDIPELFIYYFGIQGIYTYDISKKEVIKIANDIASNHQSLYASNFENELIISGWYGTGAEASIVCKKNGFGIEKLYCYAKYEDPTQDAEGVNYYFDDEMYGIHENAKKISKEKYEDAIYEIFFRKELIIFYEISTMSDSDLTLFISAR